MGDLPDFSVKVSLTVRFDEVNLRMVDCGEKYDPIVTLTEQSENDEDFYRSIILKTFRDKMTFVRKNGENIVTIKIRETSSSQRQMIYTIAALVFGIVCGFAMQFGLDAETIATINTKFVNPIRRVFLNALQMMVAPVTFPAIISGITNMSDAVQLGIELPRFQRRLVIFAIGDSNGRQTNRVAMRLTQRYDLNRTGEKTRGAT